MWLLTTIGWVVVFTIIYTVYTLLANPVGELIYSKVTFRDFNPFSASVFNSIVHYFILQGIFLVGATHFRGFVLPKTLMVLILASLVIGTLAYLSLKDLLQAEQFNSDDENCQFMETMGFHYLWRILQWAYWWLLAPLCWILTYFGLKGQEV